MSIPLHNSVELTEEESLYLREKGYVALSWSPVSNTHRNLLGSDGKQEWQVLNRMLLRYRSAQDIEEVKPNIITTTK
jgi:hypothetical protein